MSVIQSRYLEFWTSVIHGLRVAAPDFVGKTNPFARNRINFASGTRHVGVCSRVSGGELYVFLDVDDQTGDLVRRDQMYSALLEQQTAIEHELGLRLTFEASDKRRSRHIFVSRPASLDELDAEWCVETLVAFRRAFEERVAAAS